MMTFRLRSAIAALAIGAQAAAAEGVLRVGDQIAGNRAVMEAAGVVAP